MTVLLIDDEPFALKMLSQQLAGLGVQDVVALERAADAVALLEAGNQVYGLILCDLQMPEMDGVEFVRQLGRIGFKGGLILVSGEDTRILQTAEKLSRAHKLNVLGALHKPVSPEQLRKVLESQYTYVVNSSTVHKAYSYEELQQAISDKHLVNHYQPKVDITSGAVTGVETLVRWQHPDDGLVYPDQFVGLAEETGLIDGLTHNVLANALSQAKAWQEAGLQLCVAVNISMDNLGSLDFPDLVVEAIARTGLDSKRLMLEITESRLMKNPLAALDILTRLRLKHVRLSIDDFGTGHSSLAQLRDIPFDELKVDRGFVHGACCDPSLKAIFVASLGMAQQLGLMTVAEGVEDREDWDFLRKSGCNTAQGYFIARPMPAEQLPGWLTEWQARYQKLDVDA